MSPKEPTNTGGGIFVFENTRHVRIRLLVPEAGTVRGHDAAARRRK
ncbi:hypothetical protein ABZ135_07105 [Streptomyces sp. NPDC006339]